MGNEKTTLGSDIHKVGKKFFNAILGKTSVSDIVKTVVYSDLNQNKIEDAIPSLHPEISHIYMGKIHEEEEGIYSDDFLKGILEYYFYCTPPGEKVVLELANSVSEVLGENMKGFMDFDKQKEYILTFVKEHFTKKQAKRLEIINIETQHPKLFAGLRAHEKKIKAEAATMGLGYDELEKTPSSHRLEFLDNVEISPTLPEKDQAFDSLDIARYLYYLCTSNPTFFNKIKEIKPEKAKSDYYPIIEIALRMDDLLHGVQIQGGAMKQKNYDAIIREILNPYKNITEYPELSKLREFCKERMGDKKFETLYIDTKKYRTHANKIHAEKIGNSKTRMVTYVTTAALLGAVGTNEAINYQKANNTKKQMNKTIEEIFENKRVDYFSERGSDEYTGEKKIEQIQEYTQKLYDRFIFRYEGTGDISEDAFKAKIIDCLNNKKVLDILGYYMEGTHISTLDQVIDDYLIPQNIGEFKIHNISTVPYERLLPYLDGFINTILLEQDFKTDRDTTYTPKIGGFRGSNTIPAIKDIGEFAAKEGWIIGSEKYRFAMVINLTGGKYYIVATNCYRQKFDKKEHDNLSTQQAKELSIDFLKQTQPVINELLDQYLLRYDRWDDMQVMTSYGPAKNKVDRQIQNLLIKDFLRKGLLKKISKKQIDKIVNYLDEFVIENKDKLTELTGDINKNMLPNGFLQDYEEAMKNTLTSKDSVFKEHPYLAVTNRGRQSRQGNIVNHIGRYEASDGKIYLVGSAELNGKGYLYAEEEGRVTFGDKNYGYYFGEIVAKDYFKVKSQFLQKKALLEKKLKSASQRHRYLPARQDIDENPNYDSHSKMIPR